MDLSQVERSKLKEVVREILVQDSSLFKDIIKEILIENKIIVDKEQENRRSKIMKMIHEDFDKYDDVFKKLA